VGRVIARPFTGSPGDWKRTNGRRDFSIAPPGRSYLQELQDAGVEVHTVGKVGQLFAAVGIDVQHPGATNARALEQTTMLIEALESGFVFTNLVETDQVYGHRHDVPGFHRALREIDARVGAWLPMLGAGDLLVLTADHGCDPTAPHTDHTREYAPLLAAFDGHRAYRHDGSLADVGASVLAWLTGRAASDLPGISPVRPSPVCTSSAIRSTLWSRVICRKAGQ
jgi:phosphopentomutase